MGYRYYAHVSFPRAALNIPEVEEALKDADVDYFGDVIRVSSCEASYGEIDIVDTLIEFQVPYDHFHSCDCETDPDPYTEYVRYGADGGPVTKIVTDENMERAGLAEELLGLLDSGDTCGLRIRLRELAELAPERVIEEIASGWAPAWKPGWAAK